MSNGLSMLLAGIVIAVVTEEMPRWFRTVVWVFLIIVGIVLGGLQAFRL